MFYPNKKTSFNGKVNFSHRSSAFHSLMIDLEQAFKEKFGLQDYKLIFVTGSGTLVNEMVLEGFVPIFYVYGQGKFENRLRDLRKKVNKKDLSGNAYVQYETSESKCNKEFYSNNDYSLVFSDCISSFPYYDIPANCDVFTTVSGKQLGAHAGIGIIGLNKKAIDQLEPIEESYLSLSKHLEYSVFKNETPYTPAMPLYLDLLKEVQAFDLDRYRRMIDRRREMLEDVIPAEFIVGEGPVLSVKKEFFDKLFYGDNGFYKNQYNFYETPIYYQLFLWSEFTTAYEHLVSDIRQNI